MLNRLGNGAHRLRASWPLTVRATTLPFPTAAVHTPMRGLSGVGLGRMSNVLQSSNLMPSPRVSSTLSGIRCLTRSTTACGVAPQGAATKLAAAKSKSKDEETSEERLERLKKNPHYHKCVALESHSARTHVLQAGISRARISAGGDAAALTFGHRTLSVCSRVALLVLAHISHNIVPPTHAAATTPIPHLIRPTHPN
jgi:hypothetical protein